MYKSIIVIASLLLTAGCSETELSTMICYNIKGLITHKETKSAEFTVRIDKERGYVQPRYKHIFLETNIGVGTVRCQILRDALAPKQ